MAALVTASPLAGQAAVPAEGATAWVDPSLPAPVIASAAPVAPAAAAAATPWGTPVSVVAPATGSETVAAPVAPVTPAIPATPVTPVSSVPAAVAPAAAVDPAAAVAPVTAAAVAAAAAAPVAAVDPAAAVAPVAAAAAAAPVAAVAPAAVVASAPAAVTADTTINWISPTAESSIVTGDKIEVSWSSVTPIANPCFKLCVSADSCGSPIWPDISNNADGTNHVTLTPPTMDADTPFYLVMRGDDMANHQSPGFTLLSGSETPLARSSTSSQSSDDGTTDSDAQTAPTESSSADEAVTSDISTTESSSTDQPAVVTEGTSSESTDGSNSELHQGPGPSMISVLSEARQATASAPQSTGTYLGNGGLRTSLGNNSKVPSKSGVNGPALAASLLLLVALGAGVLIFLLRKRRRNERNTSSAIAYTGQPAATNASTKTGMAAGVSDVEKGSDIPARSTGKKELYLKSDCGDSYQYSEKSDSSSFLDNPMYGYTVPVLTRNSSAAQDQTRHVRDYVHPEAFEGARYYPFQSQRSKPGSNGNLRPISSFSSARSTPEQYYQQHQRDEPRSYLNRGVPSYHSMNGNFVQTPEIPPAVYQAHPRPTSEPSYPSHFQSSPVSRPRPRSDRSFDDRSSLSSSYDYTPQALSTPFLPRLKRVPYRSNMGLERRASEISESSQASSYRSTVAFGRSDWSGGKYADDGNDEGRFGEGNRRNVEEFGTMDEGRYNIRRGRVEDKSMRSLYRDLHRTLQMNP